jgi:alpha-ketoglutaric semialdehyde dehydrogenase
MNTATQLRCVLMDGQWTQASASSSFQATNPQTRAPLEESYPVSDWADCDRVLDAATRAFSVLQGLPVERIASFLEAYADRIEKRAVEIAQLANLETALPVSPRLQDVELPRTTGQLRQAAVAAREESWRMATIDTGANIRSYLAPIGPVAVLGPNNFPLAFNSVAGGDFAAAIAAGNPVIGKANSSHPGTTQLLAEEAQLASDELGMPPGMVQLLYRLTHEDGERLVADPRLAATGYTGSRQAGLRLKAAADAAGKPIFLELSSINPVILLPGAIRERGREIAEEFTASCLMGAGQFCTNPGVVTLLAGDATEQWIREVTDRFARAPVGTLLSGSVEKSLASAIDTIENAAAQRLTPSTEAPTDRFCCANTLLRVSGQQFLAQPDVMQTEAFGNASLLVVAADVEEAANVVESMEGNLTGTIYSARDGEDDSTYERLSPGLRLRVGRLLNDKMPTGVAVSPAMNHGGPYPATGNALFTAVGIPASLQRFSALQCFDNVRPARLPVCLQDKNPHRQMWRNLDGSWTRSDVDTP